ncbi:MAG: hypothetical protein STHCBS139747_004278 [Sporothrix thermara]
MAGNYASPVHGDGGTPGSYPVFPMPPAIIVARGFQIFISLLIMVMAGMLMHGLVLSAYAFAFACGFLTLVITLYAILSEKVSSCRAGYNYWAVFSLDLIMMIFWLASMGANAALRGTFKYSVNAECYDDGSTLNAGTCYTSKRDGVVAKRSAVASKAALAEISAIAGLSAVQMLLFVATFAYLAHQVRLHLQAQKQGIQSDDAAVVEMKNQYGLRVSSAPVYDPEAPYAGGLAPVQHYSAQAYPMPMPYDASSYGSPAPAGTFTPASVYGGPATVVYDPHAQAQSAAYAASAQPTANQAMSPASPNEYIAAQARHTPEPFRTDSMPR